MSDQAKQAPVIVDLGKKKRGDVKALRRGEGQLMDDVKDAISELSATGAVANGSQPVIVVVERKPKTSAVTDWL